MELNTVLLIVAVALGLFSVVACIILLVKRGDTNDMQRYLAERQDARLKELTSGLAQGQGALQNNVNSGMQQLDKRISAFGAQNEAKLENIRLSVNAQLAAMQAGNEKKLEEMRHTVDEKLQSTLEARLKQSFSLVNEGLSQVHKGLGEMQNLAADVGDLKKVMGNVKTRGILGEIQLAAILEEILSPEQYETNVATVKGSSERVEFAVKLPGDTVGQTVWLPIDAKFPADAYAALLDAYESGNPQAVAATGAELDKRIRQFAKDIHTKYVRVPDTTEFAVMFLPVEGLYSEVVRRGMLERLQREFKVNIAGPSTMAALLNSLQMGFRTLAIQKRSGEVWQVLGEVKTEFEKFEQGLGKAKENLDRAGRQIDDLMGVRTRQIQRRLRDVEAAPASGAVEETAAAGGEEPHQPAIATPVAGLPGE